MNLTERTLFPDALAVIYDAFMHNGDATMTETSAPTVHAMSLDHPRALLVYQRAGFVPYDRRTIVVEDPRPA